MLSPEEIRTLLERAQEIHQQQQLRLDDSAEVDSLVGAAVEAGVPREAMVQALRERLAAVGRPPEVGDKAFAKSADGRYYVAEVLEADDFQARVRFFSGQEASVPKSDLRPFSILPGQKISANWPSWGWAGANVVGYDPQGLRVEVSDWASKAWVPLADIRLETEATKASAAAQAKARLAGFVIAVMGGGVGAAITYFLMR